MRSRLKFDVYFIDYQIVFEVVFRYFVRRDLRDSRFLLRFLLVLFVGIMNYRSLLVAVVLNGRV